MRETELSELIQRQVEASVRTAFARRIDVVTDDMVNEIFRDPATRADFTRLMRAAFARALEALTAPASVTGDRPDQ
jgi:hypothetical protein